MKTSLKVKLGALVLDLPRFVYSMRPLGERRRRCSPWVSFRNRDERLIFDKARLGASCPWQSTSDVHLSRVFPTVGQRLMKRAFSDWPLELSTQPVDRNDADIQVSFVMGHRGTGRLPHLLKTLACIAAQRSASWECIVVEQSQLPEIRDALPAWVKHIHTQSGADMPYSRAWALNVGARAAVGKVVVLHDNDLLIPEHYASEIIARTTEGYEIVDLKRFIFYLSEDHTLRLFSGRGSVFNGKPERVLQNAKGGSLAVVRDAYFALGGLDEAFIGWGGEDDEFWQRAQTRSIWSYGYMPLIHLWHEAPEGKLEHGEANLELLKTRAAIPVSERIWRLTDQAAGWLDQAPSAAISGVPSASSRRHP